MKYYQESKEIYRSGAPAAWEKRRDEILATKGRAGQEFFVAFLGIVEQDLQQTQERQEAAQAELGAVFRKMIESKEDWGVWYFMYMFVAGDSPFANTVFLPTALATGKPLYLYVKRLLGEKGLTPVKWGIVYQALGGAGRELAVDDLVALCGKHPGVDGEEARAYCMRGLGFTRAETAVAPLRRGLDDSSELVRNAAIDGLLRMNHPSAVGPLIVALRGAKKFRQKRDIVGQLEFITTVKDLGDNAAAWEEWYRSNGGKVE